LKPLRILQYRDFWDVPRIFLVSYGSHILLFDCKFDEKSEDFDNTYHVLLMPLLRDNELNGSWENLSEHAVASLGEIAISDIVFDESCRQSISSDAVSKLLEPLSSGK
jgi:hypothetical protein